METKTAAVSMRNVTKTFGSVIANDKVNLDIYKGEILSLLGENGSGKTTLMNMLSGIYFPDEGQIFINGKEEVIRSPKDAFDLGIGMVHQHFKLIDVLSATENIILGLPGKLNLKEATKRVEEICQKYGFEVDPKQKIYDMSVSQKQTVEIVKVLYRGADILILDEPTAVLTPQETEKLFRVLRKMRDDGKAIVIITHKMHEVESLSDRVAVLRSGQYIGCMKTKDTNVTEMTNMMVGHTVTLNIDRPDPVNPKPRIEVEGLTVRNEEGVVKLQDVSFTAKQGEVTALVGPSGGGKTTVSRLAARFWDINRGRITVGGEDISKIEPETLLSLYSIVFQDVTLFNNTIMENIRIGRKNATDEEVRAAAKLANCDEFANKLPDGYNSMIGENGCELSGGERQRISIARAFLKDAPIILLDEATASLDVENETAIQGALSRLIKNKTVLIIAHRMRTVSGADKVVVLADGIAKEQGTPDELMKQNGIYKHMADLQMQSQNWTL